MAGAPRFQVVLSESSLRRMPGGRSAEVLVDQLEHLGSLIETYERLSVRILLFEADIPYVDNCFTILRFAGQEQDLAYIEYPGNARLLRNPKELDEFFRQWHLLRGAALSDEDSFEYLKRLAEESPVEWRPTS